ncbi:MAG TPA: tetraprenyl-beta-curcumene synthase family protein [Firmicutes bacterium]|nr:tetraprenyl-beta-curcumene synthase family protein [Bacillota bacterium]
MINISRLLYCYLHHVLPACEKELAGWRRRAWAIPEPRLRLQALSSLDKKKFHCQGGAVFAVLPGPIHHDLLRFIVALQTISDYLDNLCDRSRVIEARAFALLHEAMLDAVQPPQSSAPLPRPPGYYYRLYPWQDDGGYLADLVATCREAVGRMAQYDAVAADIIKLVELYRDLQVKKHIEVEERVPQLTSWFHHHLHAGKEDRLGVGVEQWRPLKALAGAGLYWQEFAAAAGSTLGVFALAQAALLPGSADITKDSLLALYFPWICGLHILLDYLIDLSEDKEGGDLNFVSIYRDIAQAGERLQLFFTEARRRLKQQDLPAMHALVLYGLPAMYLSDPKVVKQKQVKTAQHILNTGGFWTWFLYLLCRQWRKSRYNRYT